LDAKVADALIESLPYIQSFKDDIVVVKLGGSVLFDPELKKSIVLDLAYLRTVGISVVIVHGGGKEVTEMLNALGRETRFVGGYRYTAPEDADIIEMVLSGKVNKSVVSLITTSGGQAAGISGKDGGLFCVEDLHGPGGESLGQVGRVVDVNPRIITTLLNDGFIPVVSSIACAFDGRTMNVNADEAASVLASALSSRKLIYLSDVDGLMLDGECVDELDLREAENLLDDERVTGGMIPKLEFCIDAIRNGVKDVHMINGSTPHSILFELFTKKGIGTKFTYSRRKKGGSS
jgi:acetylglutamate kinase